MNKLSLMVCQNASLITLDLKPVGLFKNKAYGFIVMATDERQGVVVKESVGYPTGKQSDTWVKFTDDTIWEKLPTGSSVTFIQTD
jgi:hypothetical protein